jgi:aromatic-L-amino-acid decarboxylase
LNTPFDCGYAFVAHADDHRAAFSFRAPYLTHATDARDQMDWNPEWSRRARGFPTYAALRCLGRRGVAELFETYCEHTRTLAKGLGGLPGAELLYEPIINQALVRFHDLREGAGEAEHDLRTDAVIPEINATGEAFFTGTTWRGRRVMRISVCNWRTDADDVQKALNSASRVVLAHGPGGQAA